MHKGIPRVHCRQSGENQAGRQPKILRLTCASDGPLKRLFHEIVIWRRLTHPNVLPVLGISPKLFPLCIVSEWMIDGNIMDFTLNHPEVNRLRLVRRPSFLSQSPNSQLSLKLAEVASGLQYLHSMEIIHSDLKPVSATVISTKPL